MVGVTIRVPKELDDWLRRKAAASFRSKNMMVVMLLSDARDADQA